MSQTTPSAATLEEFTRPPSLLGRSASGRYITVAFMALLLVLPLIAYFTGNTFYLDFATRIVCLSFAAVSLNLILGFGGMISFGHAAFIGIGAYMVGIPAYHGFESGWLHFPLAMLVSALFALVTGAVCLRTKGVYFIMITMAFAQMAYYFFLSLEEYGGDDGRSSTSSTSRTRWCCSCSRMPCSLPAFTRSTGSSIRASAWWCAVASPTRRA